MVLKLTNAHKGIKIIKNEKPRFPAAQNKKRSKITLSVDPVKTQFTWIVFTDSVRTAQ